MAWVQGVDRSNHFARRIIDHLREERKVAVEFVTEAEVAKRLRELAEQVDRLRD